MLKAFRVIMVLFTCAVMWLTPNSSIDFFRSLFILTMGYAYDYMTVRKEGEKNKDKYHVNLGIVGTMVSLIFLFVSMAGLGGMLVIELNEEPIRISTSKMMMMQLTFPLKQLLIGLLAFPILTGFELIGEVREKEGD